MEHKIENYLTEQKSGKEIKSDPLKTDTTLVYLKSGILNPEPSI